ncbi:MAG: hypothetical protein KatS3mg087_1515 [Patescibacteria group bacterium]|nr:MAG: hypothetical protein KatS3mg087_1515 [Patescibacteria group bacterium]
MIITIPIWCDKEQQEHPITLEINQWGKWTIVDSLCMQKYGRAFGLMMPCAKSILSEKQTVSTGYAIAKAASKEIIKTSEPLAMFEYLYDFFKENETVQSTFISETINQIITLKETGMPLLEQLIQRYDINIQHAFSFTIESVKQRIRNKIRIPRKLSITSSFIYYTRINNTDKIKQLLNTIIREKITIALPAIILNIKQYNPLNEIYISAVRKLASDETIRQLLYSDNLQVCVSALIILNKIDAPDLMYIALHIMHKSHNIEEIVADIIERKATDKDWNILIETFKQTNFPTTHSKIYNSLKKIKDKQDASPLLQYLKTNPYIPEEKQRQTIYLIVDCNIQTYIENPSQLLSDFEPNNKHIQTALIELFYELEKDIKTQQKVLKTILKTMQEDETRKYTNETIEIVSSLIDKPNS